MVAWKLCGLCFDLLLLPLLSFVFVCRFVECLFFFFAFFFFRFCFAALNIDASQQRNDQSTKRKSVQREGGRECVSVSVSVSVSMSVPVPVCAPRYLLLPLSLALPHCACAPQAVPAASVYGRDVRRVGLTSRRMCGRRSDGSMPRSPPSRAALSPACACRHAPTTAASKAVNP